MKKTAIFIYGVPFVKQVNRISQYSRLVTQAFMLDHGYAALHTQEIGQLCWVNAVYLAKYCLFYERPPIDIKSKYTLL